MGLSCKPIGKLKGIIYKIEIEEQKRKEEENRVRKPQKETSHEKTS